MNFKKMSVSSILAIAAVTAPAALAQLTHNTVSPAVRLASDLGPVEASKSITATVHLKLQNEAEFQKTLEDLYDPASPRYHKWLTDAELSKFAPSAQQLEAVKQQLRASGLSIVSTEETGFSIRVRGTAAALESTFNTPIHQFQRNGKVFRANLQTARLNGPAAAYVSGISGLESHQARPLLKRAINFRTGQPYPAVPLARINASGGLSGYITNNILAAPATYTFTTPGASLPVGVYYGNVYAPNPNLVPDYTAAQLQQAYGLPAAYKQGLNGKGQTIVLLEAYGYPTIQADANVFSQLNGLPQLTSSNFSIVYPEGKPANPNAGVLTGWDGEIALDVQWAHAMAPGAKIVVVAASGQDDNDFQDAMQYIINHKLGNSVSDSWELDTDLIAGAAEQNAFERILSIAAAKGISFQFSTGDSGDGGLGSPVGAAGVPSVEPHATAVGGTAIFNKVGAAGTQTLGWGDTFTFLAENGPLDPPSVYGLAGGAGGGESIYWAKPSWQKSLPGTGRQTPDVSALADPYTGVPIVVTVNGKQELEPGVGGTSLASPIFTAIWAIANQKAGHPLGQAARAVAAKQSSVQDVLPLSSSTNVAGTVFDSNGATPYSASSLFGGSFYTTVGFTSAVWNETGTTYIDAGFGIDSSLTVTSGWDNVTGYGTPNGMAFINAVAK